MPRNRGIRIARTGDQSFDSAIRGLADFSRNLNQANIHAAEGWRLQQKKNSADKQEGLITGIIGYRLRSMAAGAAMMTLGSVGSGFSDALRFAGPGQSGQIFANSVGLSFANFMSKNADIGGAFSQTVDPMGRALQSTGEFTTMLARVGGSVDGKTRKALFTSFLEQENRVYNELEQLGKFYNMDALTIQNSMLGDKKKSLPGEKAAMGYLANGGIGSMINMGFSYKRLIDYIDSGFRMMGR